MRTQVAHTLEPQYLDLAWRVADTESLRGRRFSCRGFCRNTSGSDNRRARMFVAEDHVFVRVSLFFPLAVCRREA